MQDAIFSSDMGRVCSAVGAPNRTAITSPKITTHLKHIEYQNAKTLLGMNFAQWAGRESVGEAPAEGAAACHR